MKECLKKLGISQGNFSGDVTGQDFHTAEYCHAEDAEGHGRVSGQHRRNTII